MTYVLHFRPTSPHAHLSAIAFRPWQRPGYDSAQAAEEVRGRLALGAEMEVVMIESED